jgi:hypothetical protein
LNFPDLTPEDKVIAVFVAFHASEQDTQECLRLLKEQNQGPQEDQGKEREGKATTQSDDLTLSSTQKLLDLAKRKTYWRGQKLHLPSWNPTLLHLDELTAMIRGLKHTTERLAADLSSERHFFIGSEGEIETFQYDPRFLVFEFNSNFMLRKRQVELVNFFYRTVKGDAEPAKDEKEARAKIQRRAAVQQMIMGAGKTTVVGPLLALLLADGKSLVTVVVPDSLLAMSRTMMRNVFSHVLVKQVLTLSFDRSSPVNSSAEYTAKLARKLKLARRERSVVCTTPASIKSLMLQYIHLLSKVEEAEDLLKIPREAIESRKYYGGLRRRAGDVKEAEKVADTLAEIIEMWGGKRIAQNLKGEEATDGVEEEGGVVLLDEIDTLLHPLKSELNFPIGAKRQLALNPERFQLPLHLMDGFLYSHLSEESGTPQSPDHGVLSSSHSQPFTEAELEIVREIARVLRKGEEELNVQSKPHRVLLDKEGYYNLHLKDLFGSWVLVWLYRQKSFKKTLSQWQEKEGEPDGTTREQEARRMIHEYVSAEIVQKSTKQWIAEVLGTTDSDTESPSTEENSTKINFNMSLLNLARQWVTGFLAHCLSKINRISFGLLRESDIQRLRKEVHVSLQRLLLAVPFIGKDVPANAAEFAHPEVLIGLTVLAYRYEGLRRRDVRRLVLTLKEEVQNEAGLMKDRPSFIRFQDWVDTAKAQAKRNEEEEESKTEEKDKKDKKKEKVLPLNLFQPSQKRQLRALTRLLCHQPQVIHYYLEHVAFPLTLTHQTTKLTSNGYDLGSEILFKSRVGFSGTPSDILPKNLGKCKYEPGSEGNILRTLADPQVIETHVISDGSIDSILRYVANGNFRALIDVGGLITGPGLTNKKVARKLLELGLEDVDACVYLNDDNVQMVVGRAKGGKGESKGEGEPINQGEAKAKAKKATPVPLSRAGVSVEKRFTFYDQIHTTGMDIKQATNARYAILIVNQGFFFFEIFLLTPCRALVTLGKDNTLRDLAQGCWRMRGIGNGQRLQVLIIKEVEKLVVEANKHNQKEEFTETTTETVEHNIPMTNVISWLLGMTISILEKEAKRRIIAHFSGNQLSSELLQYTQLYELDAQYVWRKSAFDALLASTKDTQKR